MDRMQSFFTLQQLCVNTIQSVYLQQLCMNTIQGVYLQQLCMNTIQGVYLQQLCMNTIQGVYLPLGFKGLNVGKEFGSPEI